MYKPLFLFAAALSIGVAPSLSAQGAGAQAAAAPSPATVSRMLAVKMPKTKASTLPRPTAKQRASTIMLVTMPNGEQRYVRRASAGK
jgi:hypothetical protein